ncbi:MAG TPA: hypothetical protein VKB54_19300 [Solirubrobacteraceae bacterium]|nr:hypothetical protein [Solirubrobacteraceae bacterium]
MAYVHPSTSSIHLGLRARLRATREARMASPHARGRLAEQLERAIARATEPRRRFTAAIPVAGEAAGEARGPLLDLAERLRRPRPVDPEGVRLARRLLVDGTGPLYVHGAHGELRAAALRALGALDGHGARR